MILTQNRLPQIHTDLGCSYEYKYLIYNVLNCIRGGNFTPLLWFFTEKTSNMSEYVFIYNNDKGIKSILKKNFFTLCYYAL